ncbi:hypothetical protein ASG29_08425 [Sphingomonas sp. Leaf412]|uniref:endonuclease domain-containing protein n=1 Tax=Sphingomonas sp. Leaf412 TaxID=1736370 RepID=UPI0006FD4DD4|nr:endonuclease domain-containing protein [Sphingomonas sp. Leaf412]KQT31899.1 hypothetical protein ASG29_08425 [Sphingomonas sp. Leaf412]
MHRARRLRRAMSLPEVLLWQRLRRRAGEVKFRRQHPLAPYVADFYCPAARLVVEVDGEAHNRADAPAHDARRDEWMRSRGLNVLRIAAADILRDPDAVAASVAAAASPLHRPADGPPPHAVHGEDQEYN